MRLHTLAFFSSRLLYFWKSSSREYAKDSIRGRVICVNGFSYDVMMMSLWHDFHNQALLCMPLSLLTGEAADAKAPNPSTTSVPGPAEPIYPAKPIPAAATGLSVSRYLPNVLRVQACLPLTLWLAVPPSL